MELTTGTSYNPQFGDTGMPAGFSAFGQTDHNIHGYIAEAGETISFSSSAGLCSLNDCCFEECEKTQHGTVDQKFDLYDADMNKIAYYDHSTTVTFENAGQCVPRASERPCEQASERSIEPTVEQSGPVSKRVGECVKRQVAGQSDNPSNERPIKLACEGASDRSIE